MENGEKYGCNVPWIILFDPTSACNKHCVGCWAADYGNRLNLTYDECDKLITESSALGTHFFMLTGGEPLVRKADILKLAEKHQDFAPVRYGSVDAVKYLEGDALSFCLPIPEDAQSYVQVLLFKAKGNDTPLPDLADDPDLGAMLASKPRRVRARWREEIQIRLLPGRVPGKRHRSARKCASVPRKRVRALKD